MQDVAAGGEAARLVVEGEAHLGVPLAVQLRIQLSAGAAHVAHGGLLDLERLVVVGARLPVLVDRPVDDDPIPLLGGRPRRAARAADRLDAHGGQPLVGAELERLLLRAPEGVALVAAQEEGLEPRGRLAFELLELRFRLRPGDGLHHARRDDV